MAWRSWQPSECLPNLPTSFKATCCWLLGTLAPAQPGPDARCVRLEPPRPHHLQRRCQKGVSIRGVPVSESAALPVQGLGARARRDILRRTWVPTGAGLEALERERGVRIRFVVGRSEQRDDPMEQQVGLSSVFWNPFSELGWGGSGGWGGLGRYWAGWL